MFGLTIKINRHDSHDVLSVPSCFVSQNDWFDTDFIVSPISETGSPRSL